MLGDESDIEINDNSHIGSPSSLSSISLEDNTLNDEIRLHHIDPEHYQNHPVTHESNIHDITNSFAQTHIINYSLLDSHEGSLIDVYETHEEPNHEQDKFIFPMATTVATYTPHRTIHDLPSPGAKNAPEEFRGDYEAVERFIDHYERLLNQCNVRDDEDKCTRILPYCSRNVRNLIKALDSYQSHDWDQLKEDLLDYYDADLAETRWKEKDLASF